MYNECLQCFSANASAFSGDDCLQTFMATSTSNSIFSFLVLKKHNCELLNLFYFINDRINI